MPFTVQNRHLLRPPTFAATPFSGAEVDPDNCLLFLRACDVAFLRGLLLVRDIQVANPKVYSRVQGRAQRYVWWRDPDACIPQGLLALCAMTQRLDVTARTPNPAHPSHPAYSPAPPRRLINGRTVSMPWDRKLAKHPLPPPPETIPLFPFRERDGSRFGPTLDFTGGDARAGAVSAWLPRCVRERLAECGANFREQGYHGMDDPTGKFHKMNRSAGLRRLIEAVLANHSAVDAAAPLAFRGVELYAHPVGADVWKARQDHYLHMTREIAQAHARRAGGTVTFGKPKTWSSGGPGLQNLERPVGKAPELGMGYDNPGPAVEGDPYAAFAHRVMPDLEMSPGAEALGDRSEHPETQPGTYRYAVVPVRTRCYCRQYHCAGDCGPEDAPDGGVIEHNKPARSKPRRRKVRATEVDEFKPDKLG